VGRYCCKTAFFTSLFPKCCLFCTKVGHPRREIFGAEGFSKLS